MSDFMAKMHQVRFQQMLQPRPRSGSYSASTDLPAVFKAPTSKGSEGVEGRWEEGERNREEKDKRKVRWRDLRDQCPTGCYAPGWAVVDGKIARQRWRLTIGLSYHISTSALVTCECFSAPQIQLDYYARYQAFLCMNVCIYVCISLCLWYAEA